MSQDITLDVQHAAQLMSYEPLPPSSSSVHDLDIAPWLDGDDESSEFAYPPPPPPPPRPPPSKRSFGFARKASFVLSTRLSNGGHTSNRSTESHSTAESTSSTVTDSSMHSNSPPELRKAKSSISIISTMLKKTKSRARLRSEADSIHPSVSRRPDSSQISLSPPSQNKRSKTRPKSKSVLDTAPQLPTQLCPPQSTEPELRLDLNLDQMDGIVNLTNIVVVPNPPDPSYISSPDSFASSRKSNASRQSTSSDIPLASPTTSVFSTLNPFLPTSKAPRRRATHLDFRKISPKTVIPINGTIPVMTPSKSLDSSEFFKSLPDSPSWTAPESWAVNRDDEDLDELVYSSSDDGGGTIANNGTTRAPLQNGHGHGYKRKSRRKITRSVTPSAADFTPYKIRIYSADGHHHHICSVPLSITVADLTHVLNQKVRLPSDANVVHKLYLKERGRERVLAQTEKPAHIIRRRLEQAGFDIKDRLDEIGRDDISFLLKFQYKSQLLGENNDVPDLQEFEFVDLTGRGLRTIPVALHKKADMLVTLTLSRNPMLEIPLDFIQACTTLRELRLSHMAMKKVPQSVRHSVTLHLLDISCNRVADLDDAGLDRIPELRSLKAQNNRMEKLPWYFPRLRALKYLNISNNKFKQLPTVVTEMTSLVDLDFSFNMISKLPPEIGKLTSLERLIIVGNQVSYFPLECASLVSLKVLDCRRNNLSDLSVVCMLPRLETLRADHNSTHALDLLLGPCLTTLDASHNDITQLTLLPPPTLHVSSSGLHPYTLRSLDISHAKLSSLDNLAFSQLASLQSLRMDHNSIRFIPESLGELSQLILLSCSDNELAALPASIGRLQRLETLDVHKNSLKELPVNLWSCSSLSHINATSNLIERWPPALPPVGIVSSPSGKATPDSMIGERKASIASVHGGWDGSRGGWGRYLPPLAHSLERLYLGENQFTDDSIHPLMVLKELYVLNLSFNELQDIPPHFFRRMTQLEELYLSGNKLTTVPTEDLNRLTKLSVLFLNGNRLQTLPRELSLLQSLAVLDVGSNILRYNINNTEFDWNWNFNQNLRYLNLSGNKRLEIKPDATVHRLGPAAVNRRVLADFSALKQLHVLGLMDVTTTFVQNLPDDNEDRRVRTSLSTVNNMGYGIADNLGKHLGKHTHLTMLDLVQPEFRDRKNEALFAMFGRSQSIGNNRMSKFLRDNFLSHFTKALEELDFEREEDVRDALRRSFLHLNKALHDYLFDPTKRKGSDGSANGFFEGHQFDNRSGASGIVLYLVDRMLYIANAGDALAVLSRRGAAYPLSRKHDPFDRQETARIRAAEGWVSPKGCVNDEVDVARSFGFYHLFPVVNARPDICQLELLDQDEFVIIGNHGLWDYVDYQTAVDIARPERGDPTIAAQKLRDFAISYGAEGSTMIMVISVGDIFNTAPRRPTSETIFDVRRARKKDDINILNITRLGGEVPPPTGHVALVFTDIQNSTPLWEANPGMPTAMRLHNNLLRRQLRFCGGYEVKTEGDAFMCSFPTTISALWWCMTVQSELLKESWPLEILECEDGKEIRNADKQVIARGLSVRMGIHCGLPLCEPDPITRRMDYFGPMVNRAARITSQAAGGQIAVSADVVREINAKIFETEPDTEYSEMQPLEAILAVKELGVTVVPIGEVKLKGLEVPEILSIMYPSQLVGRQNLKIDPAPDVSNSRVQFCVDQIKSLALLCLRLETLSTGRVFKSLRDRKQSIPKVAGQHLVPDRNQFRGLREEDELDSMFVYGDPDLLFPSLNEYASDADLMTILESLSIRIMNVVPMLCLKAAPHSTQDTGQVIIDTLAKRGPLDDQTLAKVLAVLTEGLPN